ncbi:MAG: hypothetical protein SGPRY_010240 [Prymnesium sp.]
MSDFDSVMALLVDAPSEVDLTIERNIIIKRKREVKPDPVITVKDGPTITVALGSSLRKTLLVRYVELYRGMNKLTNCGGAGQCSTCLVDVVEGAENLTPRSAIEEKRLKKKPESYRMSCLALINGDVTVEVPSK